MPSAASCPQPHLPLLTPLPPQIYQLPDWRLVFLVKNFPVGQRVLVDSSFGQPTTQGEARKEEATRQGELPLVKEVLLVALGSRQSRPYLLVSTGQWPPLTDPSLPPVATHCSHLPDDPTLPPRCTWTRSCSSTRPSPTTRSSARGTSKSALRRCRGRAGPSRAGRG